MRRSTKKLGKIAASLTAVLAVMMVVQDVSPGDTTALVMKAVRRSSTKSVTPTTRKTVRSPATTNRSSTLHQAAGPVQDSVRVGTQNIRVDNVDMNNVPKRKAYCNCICTKAVSGSDAVLVCPSRVSDGQCSMPIFRVEAEVDTQCRGLSGACYGYTLDGQVSGGTTSVCWKSFAE